MKISIISPKKITKRLTSEAENLGTQTARGGFWVIVTRLVTRGMDILKTLVLARLLMPSDFGTFGVVLLVLSVLDTFTQTGFQQAIIQNREESDTFLDTAWTTLVLKGAFLALIIFGLSFFASNFFDSPESAPMIRVIALNVLFSGFTNIKTVYFQKELRFHKQFKYLFWGTLAGTIISIVLAVVLRNAWALVIGMIADTIVSVIASYIAIPYKPKFTIDKEKFIRLWRFGRWLTLSSIFSFFLTDADDILVGKLLGTETLGIYQMAYRLSNLPATEVSNVVSGVAFPAYSTIQDRKDKLRFAYKRVIEMISFLSIPVGAAIFALSNSFTSFVLGEKWLAIIFPVQLLVIWGIIRSLVAATSSVFLAVGKSKLMTVLQGAQAVLMYCTIIPLTLKFGITGTSLSIVFAATIMFFFRIYYCARAIDLELRAVFLPIFASLLSVLASVISVFIIQHFVAISPMYQFGIEALSFVVFYVLSSVVISLFYKTSPISIFRYTFSKLLGNRGNN